MEPTLGMGHSLCPSEVAALTEFVGTCLPAEFENAL